MVAAALAASSGQAAAWPSREEALAAAFPAGTAVERKAEFLTEEQVARARRLAGPGVDVSGALVTRYIGRDASGTTVGTAYFDSHRVRTLQETIMVVVDAKGRIARIEILAFGEPPEYLPKLGWLDQFRGRPLDEEMSVKRGIHGITGATLSSQSVTDAVRRVLALHAVIG